MDIEPPRDGVPFAVRVTPNARAERVEATPEGGFRVWVTVPPEGGKANAAVTKALAKALGVPKSRLRLVRGGKGRNKLFCIDPG